MPTELTDLVLDEVSLVDNPANQLATVALFKRDNPMDEEIQKKDQEIETLKSENDDLKGQVTTKDTEIETLKAQVEELTKAAVVEKKEELIDFGGEMIAKSAIPAPVLKRLEEVEKAAKVEELRKRARTDLPNFKGTEDERGALLKAVDALDEKDAVMEALRAADALFASLFGEIGKKASEEDLLEPEAKLDLLAKNYQAANPGKTFEQSYTEVVSKTAEGKALYKQISKKG